jgi:hypothetical protein
MQSQTPLRLPSCPKCQSSNTTKNGTAPGKLGRVQRFRCNNCKHIWNAATVETKPSLVARASGQHSKVKPKQSPTPPSKTSLRSGSRPQTNFAPKTQAFETHAFKTATSSQRTLQFDIPLDWSSTGLLEFARAAQQNLLQAVEPFGNPIQAELEWEALNPALKVYIRARQHLDVALLVHLQTVLSTYQPPAMSQSSVTSMEYQHQAKVFPQATLKQQNKRSQKQKSHLKATREKPPKPVQRKTNLSAATVGSTPKPETEGSSTGKALSQLAIDEPDRANLLEAFSEFQTERQAWIEERTLLQRSIHDLEEIRTQNTLRLTEVTHDLERLKKQVLEATHNTKTVTPSAKISSDSTFGFARDSTRKPKNPNALPTSSSSKRTVPPLYTAREEGNMERLASSLMANLVRLEGYRVQPRDLPHITGERGPWKLVLEHLMTLGKIERRGDFIEISFAERLRRGLR